MATWYKVRNSSMSIERVENVVSSTRFFVVTETEKWGKVRVAKVSSYDQLFPTYSEARAHLVERYNVAATKAHKELEAALAIPETEE